MDIKTRFESHPVVFGLSLIVMGFVAGFGAHDYLTPTSISSLPVINCNTEGIAILAKAHNERLQSLRNELNMLEAEATSMAHIESNQQVYRDGAERIRKDVAQETTDFQVVVAALSKQCSNLSLTHHSSGTPNGAP